MEICARIGAGGNHSDQMVSPLLKYLCRAVDSMFSYSYDSIEDGSVAVLTPHTAFEDPTTPAGAPPRESIEIRALVFYDD